MSANYILLCAILRTLHGAPNLVGRENSWDPNLKREFEGEGAYPDPGWRWKIREGFLEEASAELA